MEIINKKIKGTKQTVIDNITFKSTIEASCYKILKNSGLVFAEPDRWMHPMVESITPNDTKFSEQWHLQSPEQYVGAANVAKAWSISQGSSDITIADIDTGIVGHADLVNRLIGGQASKAGYDFIVDLPTSNDNSARDTDPSDLGDWLTQAEAATSQFTDCEVGDSSWHGTHTAGIMAAQTNNATGIAGVDWNAKLLVARALGKCGGYTSDIADAMRWSAGISVPNVPTNANPAKVLNLSLGGFSETATCSNCHIPWDHIPERSYPLFKARYILERLLSTYSDKVKLT